MRASAGQVQAALALGLTRSQSLRAVELPHALPTLMAGVKTAAGTASARWRPEPAPRRLSNSGPKGMRTRTRVGWLMSGWLTAVPAQAGCSRPINVPMAPIGLSVSFDDGQAQGVYPTLLREVAASSQCKFDVQKVPRARLQSMSPCDRNRKQKSLP